MKIRFYGIILLVNTLFSIAMTGCGGIYHERGGQTVIDLSRTFSYYNGDIALDEYGSPYSGGKQIDDSDWEKYTINRPPLNKMGTMVLWVRASLPKTMIKDPVLYFPAGSYGQLFDVYLDNTLIMKFSDTCLATETGFPVQPKIISLPEGYNGKTLYLRFQSNEPGHVGINAPVYLESEWSLVVRIINRQADRLILGFIFIFTGFVSFLIFIKNRNSKFYSVLAFAIMSLSVGIFVVFPSEVAILFFINPVVSQYATLLAIIYFPVGLFLFIDRTIGPGYKLIIRRSWQIFLFLSVLAVLSFITAVRLPMLFIIIIRGTILVISVIAAIAEMVHSIVKRSFEARIISIGLLVFGCTAFIDEMSYHRGIYMAHMYFPWGYFILMNMLGYLLYRTFELTQRKLKRYSEELEEKSGILQELNRTLEEKVQERTEELREKNKILQTRNRVIENEIAMARKIQQQLIPAHDPRQNICSLYKPMDQVGGDFYDYIEFDNGRMGFFISDVSGHGIPAALITSMVKMGIFQVDARREDPAALFAYLNEMLFGQTGDNFVTAFYGIVDYSNNEILYCNAGHNPPLIILSSEITEITGKKSLPIASMRNVDLVNKRKMYENVTMILPEKSRLLFYTDGLSEAVNPEDTDVMFESVMQAILMKNNDESCHEAVHRLYDSLVDFRGSDSFDDDVCIVCVDC